MPDDRMHDIVIRNGTVLDDTGSPAVHADVPIDGDRVAAVGTVERTGRREIDGTGLLVTPGFVDMHTHYDAQATWDPYITPSGWHGVTTVVMSNCGVGFAPARPDRHDWLIVRLPPFGANRGRADPLGISPHGDLPVCSSRGSQEKFSL